MEERIEHALDQLHFCSTSLSCCRVHLADDHGDCHAIALSQSFRQLECSRRRARPLHPCGILRPLDGGQLPSGCLADGFGCRHLHFRPVGLKCHAEPVTSSASRIDAVREEELLFRDWSNPAVASCHKGAHGHLVVIEHLPDHINEVVVHLAGIGDIELEFPQARNHCLCRLLQHLARQSRIQHLADPEREVAVLLARDPLEDAEFGRQVKDILRVLYISQQRIRRPAAEAVAPMRTCNEVVPHCISASPRVFVRLVYPATVRLYGLGRRPGDLLLIG